MAELSLRGFAKSLGVDEKAIRKGVASGRLKKSVGVNKKGQPVIKNAALAMREWAANAAKVGKGTVTLVEVQRRVGLERERAMRLNTDLKEGRLIDAAVVQRQHAEASRTVREAILNIPNRISGELAAERDPAKVFTRLDTELRLALEGVAGVLSKRADDEQRPSS